MIILASVRFTIQSNVLWKIKQFHYAILRKEVFIKKTVKKQ